MRVLVNFVRKQYFMDFCLAELQALCELQNIKVHLNYGNFNVEEDWVHYIDLPSIEAAKLICSRAVLVKNIVKVYSEGKTYGDLLKIEENSELRQEEKDLKTFKFSVDAKGKSLE